MPWGGVRGACLYIHTLGCPKNEADSRGLARALAGCGVAVVAGPEQATHVLINTCGFINEAKEESIAAILAAAKSWPGKKVLVMGCLVERYRAELRVGIPEVEAWFGLAGGASQHALAELLGCGPENAAEVFPVEPSRSSYAYLKVSDGCDEPCSFCAIPAIKGPYHSATGEEVLREADACLAEGAKELVLVGQDTTLWRNGDLDLPGLVDRLAADERVQRLRIMYLQPDRVDDRFLEYMAGQPKLCRYLDVPFQHSHPDLLRRMCRAGDGDTYLGLIERARRLLPDVSVRTSFIVGFPGETEQHFEHLLDFVDRAGFDYAGGFVYSPEEGTPAAELKPRVRKTVARDRLNRLNAALLAGSERKHQALVGAKVEVMIDSIDPEELDEGVVALGRTSGQAPDVDGVTYVEGALPPGVAPGDMVVVTVESVVGFDLVGRCDAS